MKLRLPNKLFSRMLFLVSLVLILLFALLAIIIYSAIRLAMLNISVLNIAVVLIAVVLIFVLIVSQITTIIWSKRVTEPVNDISDVIEQIAQGNFDINVDTSGFDNEFKTIGNSLNKMIKELKSIEVMRSDFVSNVSHEFRAPLSAIQGYVTLLSNPSFTDEQKKEYLKMLSESTRQLSGLVDNVLKLSKLESQSIVNKKEKFSLDEQLRVAVLMFENQWSEKNINLDLDLPETEYTGNQAMLNQMWINLIGNAVKFTGENGNIGIKIINNNGRLSVRISDTGVGMSEKDKEHIFEKFYQGDSSRRAQGNGLGLALVKTIADLLECRINVESEKGKGTVFTVELS